MFLLRGCRIIAFQLRLASDLPEIPGDPRCPPTWPMIVSNISIGSSSMGEHKDSFIRPGGNMVGSSIWSRPRSLVCVEGCTDMSSSALSFTCALGGGGCLTPGSRLVDFESDLVMGVVAGRLRGTSSRAIGSGDAGNGTRLFSMREEIERAGGFIPAYVACAQAGGWGQRWEHRLSRNIRWRCSGNVCLFSSDVDCSWRSRISERR